MAKFKKFGEFLNKKHKKDTMDAKDGLAGEDYDGPLSIKPPQEPTKGKNDKPLPYKASGEAEKGLVQTAHDPDSKKGLALHSTPGVTPQTSSLGKSVEDKTRQAPKQKKLTSEEFVNVTKEMSDAEFVRFLSEANDTEGLPTVTDLFGNEFTPDPTQTFNYVASLLTVNPKYVGKFIREMKRRGAMEDILQEMFTHGDTYHHIIDHLEDENEGPERCTRLGRMMNDRYMTAVGNFDFGDGDEDLGESVGPNLDQLLGSLGGMGGGMGKPKKEKTPGGAFGGGSGPDDTPDPAYAKSGPAQGGAFGGGGPGGGEGGGSAGGPLGGQEMPQFPGQPPLMPPKKMKEGDDMPKYKGKSAAMSLINELSGYPHFKKHMIDRCADGNC